ncbi:unnamed protein product [Moneuplotes crassus]|uniref:DBF4-type domain-containing protein n=1 Tax=Euplotes crassus TaxID=5936 RepID=A0AAD1X475_EUPCR|nr:unnamed protein product [Moneuplotes crassus]
MDSVDCQLSDEWDERLEKDGEKLMEIFQEGRNMHQYIALEKEIRRCKGLKRGRQVCRVVGKRRDEDMKEETLYVTVDKAKECLDVAKENDPNFHEKWWRGNKSKYNPFHTDKKLRTKSDWNRTKKCCFLVTPNSSGIVAKSLKTRGRMYGECEIFEEEGRIPKLYLNAPEGQQIFQNAKSIRIIENNEPVRSRSRAKYHSRISQLKSAYEHPPVLPNDNNEVPVPVPFHQYCNICGCSFEDYLDHLKSEEHSKNLKNEDMFLFDDLALDIQKNHTETVLTQKLQSFLSQYTGQDKYPHTTKRFMQLIKLDLQLAHK